MLDKKECKGFLEGLLKYLKEERRNNYNEANFEKIFDEYDEDKNGFIEKSEMAVLIKKTFRAPGQRKEPLSKRDVTGVAADPRKLKAPPLQDASAKAKKPVDKLKLVIKSAKFNVDLDGGFFDGKQDPRIEFQFAGKDLQTTTKDDAGKEATWNEEFMLEDVAMEIKGKGMLKFNAYDVDTVMNDWIGAT